MLAISPRERTIRERYELLSIVNDILIAVWFLVGSVLFFTPQTTWAGTWLFVLGSVELLVRPMIRLTRWLHLQRLFDLSAAPADEPDF
ncbi:YrhK family protein [Actinomycetospora sp. NBRC 106375]|uniref:YrhK family protein n=1 Tax=Actinomycetospora sp. NBRC 106375 TaxID=3032207 RepID=UPI0025547BC1|nr:YrhK family protein [Actinomycetospora sp. NBRC 106375]